MVKMSQSENGDSGAPQFPAVVDLNIGGHYFTTLLQTLTKERGSLIADMFSGKDTLVKDDHGRYFIDADGPMFAHILNYLRVGQLPPSEVASDVCRHAEYFGIQSLVTKLQEQTREPMEQDTSPKAESKVRKRSLETSVSKVQKTSSDFSSAASQVSASSEQSPTSNEGERTHNVDEEVNKTNLIVNYLPQTMSDAGFSALFIPMGPIKTMKICRDKGGKSYGFGFVDFRNPEDAERAVRELNGKQIINKKIKVAFVQKRDSSRKEASICVKNLPEHFSAAELKDLFSECGHIIHTDIRKYSEPKELSGIVGFVVFENNDGAEKAIEKMNGKRIAGGETRLVVQLAEENKAKPAYKRPNFGPGIMGKAPSPMTSGRMMGNIPSGMMGNTPNQMMGNNPSQMMGNRPGPVAPRGPRPVMGSRAEAMISNFPRPRMANMGNNGMNARPGLMGQGPRQIMGMRPGNMNNTVMGHFEGCVPDAMRNVPNQQQNVPFAHNSGPSQGGYYNQQGMGMTEMPKPLMSLGCTLYVNNVGQQCDQTDLYRLFAPYGALIKVDVMKDKDTDKCKGYAFVTFMNSEEAESAILMLNGFNFKGRSLQVSYKK